MHYDLESVFEYTRPLSLLYVEDNPVSRETMKETLSLLCAEVQTAENGEEGLMKYRRFYRENGRRFDIVVTDIQMPGGDGIDMSRRILSEHPRQPVVVLSAHDESGGLIEMINIGVHRFLHKPVNAERLFGVLYEIGHSIAQARERRRLEAEVQALNRALAGQVDRLRKLANEDPLTGIANRRCFFEAVSPVFEGRRDGEPAAFLFVIDIDRFKRINDEHGHAVGDRVILVLAETVRKYAKERDLFARMGGDEFVLLLTDCTREEAFSRAEAIRREIDAERSLLGVRLRFTVSMGMAAVTAEDGSIDDVIRRADRHLYRAKKQVRNSVEGMRERMAGHDSGKD